MNKPQIKELASGYDFRWEDEGVTIKVRRLSMHSDEVKGEITISCDKASGGSHLKQCSFNFSSDVMRKRLAKDLDERYELDWVAILEQICVYTLEYFRKGDVATEINTEDISIAPPEYLIYPFVIKNYPSIIFGEPSASKSLLANIIATMVILPWQDNPLNWQTPCKSYKVLYLDWETDEATVKWTLHCLSRGMKLGYLSLHYRHCSFPLAHDVEQIAEWVDDTGADLTIIDSLGMAAGGDANATEPAFQFWAAWRKLRTTSLILAHTSKSNEEGAKKSVFGSQYYTAEARNIWEVRKTQEPGSKEMDIGLFHRKPPPFTGLHESLGLHVSFSGNGVSDGITISERSIANISEFEDAIGTGYRIEKLLQQIKCLSTKEIISELGITEGNARLSLKRLKDKGKITKTENGLWQLILNQD